MAVNAPLPQEDIRLSRLPRVIARIMVGWSLMAIFEASNRITRALLETGLPHYENAILAFYDGAAYALATYCCFLLVDRYPLDRLTWRRLFTVLPALFLIALSTFVVSYGLRILTGFKLSVSPAESLLQWGHARLFATFIVLGMTYGIQYAVVSRHRALRAARLEAEVLRAQLQSLRAQLQPHFLFNTLNVIGREVRRSPEMAEELIGRLGDLLRMSLEGIDRPLTTVLEEVEFVTVYLDLQRARLGDRLRSRFTIDNEALHAVVPSFLLQPIVENAVRHGVEKCSTPTLVSVDVRREGETLIITVSDDGHGLVGDPREGLGMKATRERMARQYGPRAMVILSSQTGGGTRVVLRLPFQHQTAL